MATSLKAATYEEGLENQKKLAEQNKAEIALMSKGSPEQFKAQCERLKAQRTRTISGQLKEVYGAVKDTEVKEPQMPMKQLNPPYNPMGMAILKSAEKGMEY